MSLLDCTNKLLHDVEVLSGRPVRVFEDPSMGLMATVKMARGSAPFHVVTYRPMANHQPDYRICFEAGFILRLFENPPSSRFDFTNSGEASRLMDEAMAQRPLAQPVVDMKETLQRGVLTQLRSVPIGLRVDEWLWERFPELRQQQILSVKAQLQENVGVLKPSIRNAFPPLIVAANSAMNAAYALFWSSRMGEPAYSLPYRSVGAAKAGERLLEILRGTDPAPANDWGLVDRWANEVRLSGWYRWVPFKLEE